MEKRIDPDDVTLLRKAGLSSDDVARITSYNVCYTKLLRQGLAPRHPAARPHVHGGHAAHDLAGHADLGLGPHRSHRGLASYNFV